MTFISFIWLGTISIKFGVVVGDQRFRSNVCVLFHDVGLSVVKVLCALFCVVIILFSVSIALFLFQ